ncbi:hypothetical protein ZIOFF_044824 [Zingiber officinale]|uniref:Cell wall hydroxyproline-rich glycoprotein n=1 Tax=Zingiber officinale TaxID=94328 RepID=A0A8J5KUR8_ZINOF|nr:hypothetical protein ZIOFF_044824 [Zingiber officinale]
MWLGVLCSVSHGATAARTRHLQRAEILPSAAAISGYEDMPANDKVSLRKAVAHQPVSVAAIEASEFPFQFDKGGILAGYCSTDLDDSYNLGVSASRQGKPFTIIPAAWLYHPPPSPFPSLPQGSPSSRRTMEAFGRSLLFLLLFSFSLSDALSDVEVATIARRQLAALSENQGQLPKDLEFDIKIGIRIANPRLRRAYVALQAWKDAIYSDPKNFTGDWVGPDICSYNGVVCASGLDDSSVNVVAGVDLNGGDIAGYLPAELGLLNDTALFHINSNRFCGVIPESFSQLKILHEFDVSNNRFVGPFPKVVLQLSSLRYLDLRFNDFEGALPPELFDKDLDAIFLNDNRFTSGIPENFGNSKASVVVLANNQLGGCIPRSIGNMGATLNELVILDNGLTGCLPLEMGLLGNATVVDVSRNSLTGVLTAKSFEGMSKLKQLEVSHNILTGVVPAGLCKLPDLASFGFAYNFFKGEAEECVPSTKSRVAYNDSSNCLSGRPGQKSSRLCTPVVNHPVDFAAAGTTWCFSGDTFPLTTPTVDGELTAGTSISSFSTTTCIFTTAASLLVATSTTSFPAAATSIFTTPAYQLAATTSSLPSSADLLTTTTTNPLPSSSSSLLTTTTTHLLTTTTNPLPASSSLLTTTPRLLTATSTSKFTTTTTTRLLAAAATNPFTTTTPRLLAATSTSPFTAAPNTYLLPTSTGLLPATSHLLSTSSNQLPSTTNLFSASTTKSFSPATAYLFSSSPSCFSTTASLTDLSSSTHSHHRFSTD